jgi:hypothetical protein
MSIESTTGTNEELGNTSASILQRMGSVKKLPTAIALDTSKFAFYLAAVALVLVITGTIANLIIYQVAEHPEADVARVMARFDLGHEPSLPAFFSSVVLLLNGAMLILISRAKRQHDQTYVVHWLLLGIIFIALSIDETVMFHEMIDKLIGFAVQTSGFLSLPWVIVGGAFALLVFFSYANFLLHIRRRSALLFVASGALYVGGAVGMEVIAAGVIDQHSVESIYHTIVQTIEESLEMAGAILFFYALGDYWSASYGPLHIASSASTSS